MWTHTQAFLIPSQACFHSTAFFIFNISIDVRVEDSVQLIFKSFIVPASLIYAHKGFCQLGHCPVLQKRFQQCPQLHTNTPVSFWLVKSISSCYDVLGSSWAEFNLGFLTPAMFGLHHRDITQHGFLSWSRIPSDKLNLENHLFDSHLWSLPEFIVSSLKNWMGNWLACRCLFWNVYQYQLLFVFNWI